MPDPAAYSATTARPTARKFHDPEVTANGERRASVVLGALRTLWFNTGTLCNIACVNCYIESSPTNDRLAYLSAPEVRPFLDEIVALSAPVEDIGFTGGEPFLNRELPEMLALALERGFAALVLTNAMTPLRHRRQELRCLRARHGDRLRLRVSIDHHEPAKHERVRGPNTWRPMLEGLRWLAEEGFALSVAGRALWREDEEVARAGYRRLFVAEGVAVDADDPKQLVLFPEMAIDRDVPEITERCWELLGKSPGDVMCASQRMVVKRKGAAAPVVVACTLLPYDPRFELGATLRAAAGTVRLNHPFCAQFCVLGGASCSAP